MCTYACLIDPTDNCSIKPVREAAFSKTTNSHKFYNKKSKTEERSPMSTQPPLCLRDLGQHFHKPNPANHISLFQRDTDCSRIIILSGFWHCLGYPFLLYSHCLVFFFFELFLKVKVLLCYSHSKGQPLDGGCICYRNICIT